MRIHDVMILWNDREEHKDCVGLPQVRVVNHLGGEVRDFSYLNNSIGACFRGWLESAPEKLAAHLAIVFMMMVADGVPGDSAHQEFMKIDEYREWHEMESGPFASAYWEWEKQGAGG